MIILCPEKIHLRRIPKYLDIMHDVGIREACPNPIPNFDIITQFRFFKLPTREILPSEQSYSRKSKTCRIKISKGSYIITSISLKYLLSVQ